MPEETTMESLRRFVTGNLDLYELEAVANRFNIFEALGVVRKELHHSRFLGFLCDPSASHGIEDLFLKRLLQSALIQTAGTSEFGPIHIDLSSFRETEVRFEYLNIDVLVRDVSNKLILIIENKVDSTQHSDQLRKYFDSMKARYPDFKIIGVYLTRDGEDSKHEAYASLSHQDVCRLIEEVISRSSLHLDPTMKVALNQYADMLRRHFMADEEVSVLCRKIYRRHKQAIDLIIENMPDRRETIAAKVRALIQQQTNLIPNEVDPAEFNRSYIRFTIKALDKPCFKGAIDWTSSGRIVLFEFRNQLESLKLVIQLGKGPQGKRAAILQMARDAGKPFSPENKLYTYWNRLYSLVVLEKGDYELDDDELDKKIDARWAYFLSHDLPVLETKIEAFQMPLE